MEKQVITLVDSLGFEKRVEVVGIVPSKRENKVYLVYTDVNDPETEMVDLYFAILNENQEELRISEIETDEEFSYVKTLFEEQAREV